ncbi:hypothetical protein AAIA72_10505 [Hahella sp. SMD15-11]|uniref:Chemotaxis protein CheW n=1 Tax=Thermohahella caldifontis TaxID=3142973 RepID=A0AB39UTV1_9GAMM
MRFVSGLTEHAGRLVILLNLDTLFDTRAGHLPADLEGETP